MVSRKNAQHLVNALIERGEVTDLSRAVQVLQKINNHLGKESKVVLCSFCATKIGVHVCSGCRAASETRYCSKICQIAAWPAHKKSCGIIDVE